MKQQTAITKLKSHAQMLRSMGATALYLFGSTATNKAKVTSDVDVFIDINPRGRFTLFDLMAMKRYLEDALHTDVDLMTRGSLHPMLKRNIEQSAVQIF